MRFGPAAAALSLFVAVSASVGHASAPAPDPRAEALVAEGRAHLEQGDTQGAIDAFEAALAVDPAWAPGGSIRLVAPLADRPARATA